MQRLIEWYSQRHPDLPTRIQNEPINADSLDALKQLEEKVLTPLEQQFGAIT